MKLEGNTIFITGGGSGIGRALAEALHQRGNKVIISGRRKTHLAKTVEANPGMESIELDIADPTSVHRVANELIMKYPTLNVLINNAGIMQIDNASAEIDDELITSSSLEPRAAKYGEPYYCVHRADLLTSLLTVRLTVRRTVHGQQRVQRGHALEQGREGVGGRELGAVKQRQALLGPEAQRRQPSLDGFLRARGVKVIPGRRVGPVRFTGFPETHRRGEAGRVPWYNGEVRAVGARRIL